MNVDVARAIGLHRNEPTGSNWWNIEGEVVERYTCDDLRAWLQDHAEFVYACNDPDTPLDLTHSIVQLLVRPKQAPSARWARYVTASTLLEALELAVLEVAS